MTPLDPVRALLRLHAHQILAGASSLPVEAPVSVAAGDDLLTVTIVIAPAGTKAGRPLTPCERDCLALLEQATCRMSTTRVQKELAARGLHHGDSTVSRSLTRLAKAGVIRASRRAPRGYYLPGKSMPLFTDPA